MNLLFSFSGRIGRGKFWLGVLLYLIIAVVVTVIINLVFPMADFMPLNPDGTPQLSPEGMPVYNFSSPYFLASMLISIPLIWISLAISVKRCHDRGKSGWWCLLLLIPFVGFIWWLVDLGILEGQEGENRWGPNLVPQTD